MTQKLKTKTKTLTGKTKTKTKTLMLKSHIGILYILAHKSLPHEVALPQKSESCVI